MPIYEYECKQCGYRFEQLQKITEKPPRVCPECKKPKLTKLVSNTSFQLKGTGWYVTDFKNSGSQKEQKSGSAETAAMKKETKPTEKIKKET